MVIKQLTVGNMAVCCYIVSCPQTRQAAVVDPGGSEELILAEVKRAGLEVRYIIATHGHPDHVCGIRRIKEATGAEIVMHRADAAFFWQPDTQHYFSMLGLEQSPPPDRLVEDGDIIELGNERLQVIHTPGHTPGGICLLCGHDLLTGDTLFVGGIGRTDFPGGSHQELMNSIKNRLMVLPDDTVVWPGHGYGGSRSTLGEELKTNPYL
jgi:glyoxylase-like metal-dependent hydrolase (beta-lactamase superfamily II)